MRFKLAFAFSSLRAAIYTFAPFRTRIWTTANPIPDLRQAHERLSRRAACEMNSRRTGDDRHFAVQLWHVFRWVKLHGSSEGYRQPL